MIKWTAALQTAYKKFNKSFCFKNSSTLNILWIHFIDTMAIIFREGELWFLPKYYNMDFHMNKVFSGSGYAQKLSNEHWKSISLNTLNATAHTHTHTSRLWYCLQTTIPYLWIKFIQLSNDNDDDDDDDGEHFYHWTNKRNFNFIIYETHFIHMQSLGSKHFLGSHLCRRIVGYMNMRWTANGCVLHWFAWQTQATKITLWLSLSLCVCEHKINAKYNCWAVVVGCGIFFIIQCQVP